MKENSRIRFNPVTGEIEVEGSEAFVKDYFHRLQALLAGSREKTAPPRETPGAAKAARTPAGEPPPKVGARTGASRSSRGPAGRPAGERITQLDQVIGIVRDSAEGISTAGLVEKTGLSTSQLWNIVNRATKAGKIRKLKRGLYVAGAAAR